MEQKKATSFYIDYATTNEVILDLSTRRSDSEFEK